MKMNNDVNNYIKGFSKDVELILKKVRGVIRKAAPEAEEVMGYGIPTYKLNGNLVHFGGFKKHIGFFPSPSGINKFKKQLIKYKVSKGTIQFPLENPIPFDLIQKITKFRVKENKIKRKNR